MFTTTATDKTTIQAYSEGTGPTILMLHPGLDDGTRSRRLAARLSKRFRVVRLHRRQYRTDLKLEPAAAVSIETEVDDVLSVVISLGADPVLLYGHSSGGVVAMEAMVRSPGSFVGAVIYEPAIVTSSVGMDGEVVERARALLAKGRTGKAFEIFTREVIKLPALLAWVTGVLVALVPKYRRLARCQIDELQAILLMGDRLDAYAEIDLPVSLLGGERSPAHLAARLDALERVLPDAGRVVMPRRDHAADLKAPAEVAGVIERLADQVLPTRKL